MAKGIIWPFHVADYRRDTRHLSWQQHGAYFLLLSACWDLGSLPDDDAVLRRIIGMDAKSWRRHKPVLAAFFHIEDGRWKHKRIARDLAEAERLRTLRTAAAGVRWNDGKRSGDVADISCLLGAAEKKSKSLKSNEADDASAYANGYACASSPIPYKKELTNIVSSSLDAEAWFATNPKRGETSWRIFAYEAFKRAPGRALDIDIQADKFREYNSDRKKSAAEWWQAWEAWCRQAVQFVRRPD